MLVRSRRRSKGIIGVVQVKGITVSFGLPPDRRDRQQDRQGAEIEFRIPYFTINPPFLNSLAGAHRRISRKTYRSISHEATKARRKSRSRNLHGWTGYTG